MQDLPTYDDIGGVGDDDDDDDDDAIVDDDEDDLLGTTSTPAVLRTPGRLFPSNRQELSIWVGGTSICVFVTVSLYLCICIG